MVPPVDSDLTTTGAGGLSWTGSSGVSDRTRVRGKNIMWSRQGGTGEGKSNIKLYQKYNQKQEEPDDVLPEKSILGHSHPE